MVTSYTQISQPEKLQSVKGELKLYLQGFREDTLDIIFHVCSRIVSLRTWGKYLKHVRPFQTTFQIRRRMLYDVVHVLKSGTGIRGLRNSRSNPLGATTVK